MSKAEKIFKKIEFLKNKHKYSDVDIAKALDLTPSAYSRIKNEERRLPIEYIEKIADFFKVPFYYMFFVEGELDKFPIAEGLSEYVKENDGEYGKVAQELDINIIRFMELCRGSKEPNSIEFMKLKEILHCNSEDIELMDGRVELVKLLLKDLMVDESDLRVVLDYIANNSNKLLNI